MNLNLLKLRKSLLQLAEVETDKGVLVIESELAEGVEVFVEDENGEWIPAEDGESYHVAPLAGAWIETYKFLQR